MLSTAPANDSTLTRRLLSAALDREAELDYDSAAALLRNAIRIAPAPFDLHYHYLEIQKQRKAWEEVRRDYAGFHDVDQAQRECALAIADAGDYADPAVGTYQRIEQTLGLSPCAAVYFALGTFSLTPVPYWRSHYPASGARAVQLAPGIPGSWAAYAQQLIELGQYAAAVRVLERGIARQQHPLTRLTLHLERVKAMVLARDTLRARAALAAAQAAVARDGRPGLQLAVLRTLAYLRGFVDQPIEDVYQELFQLGQRYHAWPVAWSAAIELGGIYLDLAGAPRRALPWYERSLAAAAGQTSFQAYSASKIGRTYAKLGQLAAAERMLQRALLLAKHNREPPVLAEAYHNLAHVYEGAARWREAAAAGEEFIRAAQHLPHAELLSVSYRDAGMIRWKAGWHAAAHAAFLQMVRVVNRQQRGYNWAGEYFERIGQLDSAATYYALGRAVDTSLGNRARNLAGLTRVYAALGRYDSAAVTAREHDAGVQNEVEVPLLPTVLARQGRPLEAARIARSFAESRQRDGHVQGAARGFAQTAELLLAGLHVQEAWKTAQRADSLARTLQLIDEMIAAQRLIGLAAMTRRDTSHGLAALQRAAELARSRPTSEAVLSTQLALGRSLASLGRVDEALTALSRAAAAVEMITAGLGGDFDRIGFHDANIAPFNAAMALLLRHRPHDLSTLLIWSQRRKAAALALAARARAPGVAEPRPPLRLPELRRRLDQQTAVIDFTMLDSVVAAIVLMRNSAQAFTLPVHPDTLRRWIELLRVPLVTTYSRRVDVARAVFNEQLAERIAAVLLAPLGSLADARRLAIIPDDVLHLLPFEPLPFSPDFRFVKSGATPLLLDRLEVVYLPSLAFLRTRAAPVQHQATRLRRLLVFADTSAGSLAEVAAIRTVWPQDQLRVLEGAAATETASGPTASRFGVVHFATHASVDSRDPLGSHLELAPDPGNDGLLHVSEIGAQRRNAQLVVLSACSSLTGPMYAGEGVTGLARAFLAAGARDVIATHWPVGEPSALLFATFYRHLARGESVSSALRHAKLELRRNPQTSQPFYWAPFVVIAGL